MKIYNYIKSTKTLGPYNRFALWVQGCPFSCTECMSPDSQDFNSGLEMSISAIVDLILNEINIEGLTISGGEPFSQANELVIEHNKRKKRFRNYYLFWIHLTTIKK